MQTKSKTANHCSISTLQQVRPKQYCFQTNLIEPRHVRKIGLNFDIPSPTKFVNFFFFFKFSHKSWRTDYLIQFFWETSSCIKNAATELLRIWKRPYNYFIFERTRSSISSNSIHVTRPDNGWEALILNKADYYSKVNAVLSDTYKFSLLYNDTHQHS